MIAPPSADIGVGGNVDRSLIDIQPAGERVITGKQELARTKGRNAAGPADDRGNASAGLAGIDRSFSAAEGQRTAASSGIFDGPAVKNHTGLTAAASHGQRVPIGVDGLRFGVQSQHRRGSGKDIGAASGAGIVNRRSTAVLMLVEPEYVARANPSAVL